MEEEEEEKEEEELKTVKPPILCNLLVLKMIHALHLITWLEEFWYRTAASQPAGSNRRHH